MSGATWVELCVVVGLCAAAVFSSRAFLELRGRCWGGCEAVLVCRGVHSVRDGRVRCGFFPGAVRAKSLERWSACCLLELLSVHAVGIPME